MNHDIENECRCEPSDWAPPAGYSGDGSVAALAAAAAQPTDQEVADCAEKIKALRDAAVDDLIASGRMGRAVFQEQASLQNEVHRVWFRAGLLACREYMARFVEAESPAIAASIRANWWPTLGADPGAPRQLNWAEVADGGEEGPWTARNPGESVEALPIAAQFLTAQGR